MKVVITGSAGFIGSALVPALGAHAYRVCRLVRRAPRPGTQDLFWDPDAGRLDPSILQGVDAVVHLAGANIAAGRWTRSRKAQILDSRVRGTRLLAETLNSLDSPPGVLVSTSAIGFYGDRGDEILDEDSAPGTGFLADVCREWEGATAAATGGRTRVVVLRLGMVLGRKGGALKKMIPPFRLGLGGRLGSGDQFISWISLDDLLEIIHFAITTPHLRGAVNAVSPNPVTNRFFTQTLGRVLRRPTLFSLPTLVLRALFGEMGKQVFLASSRVNPARLLAAGFRFRYPELEGVLRRELAR